MSKQVKTELFITREAGLEENISPHFLSFLHLLHTMQNLVAVNCSEVP